MASIIMEKVVNLAQELAFLSKHNKELATKTLTEIAKRNEEDCYIGVGNGTADVGTTTKEENLRTLHSVQHLSAMQ